MIGLMFLGSNAMGQLHLVGVLQANIQGGARWLA